MRKILYVECGKYKFNASDPGVEGIDTIDIDSSSVLIRVFHKDGTLHTIMPKETYLLKISEDLPDIVVPEIILDQAS